MCSPLVSCEWLKEQLVNKNPNIRILDGTWNQPAWKRNAQQEYLDGHIEGAVRFDIGTVCDKDSPIPGLTLPTDAQFTENVQKGSWGDWVRRAPAETMMLGVKGEDMPK
ncbi:3-mercaptopyruvate sulfurtransferase-like [Halichondria panicea]|uniref:3-mercaptopyruvate sulfurtransferase-like n=1 Tax=Halichondria panicea TaxID=6063 RepID=UPI00312B605A